MLIDHDLTLGSLLRVFRGRISLTWAMVFIETVLWGFVPLFIGFAIDGLLEDSLREFLQLAGLMIALVLVAVIRRLYDTRAYGTIRVELGKAQGSRSSSLPVSKLNARFSMGRELVDFLEHTLPEAMAAVVNLAIAVIILFAFSPVLAAAAAAVLIVMVLVYAMFHKRFYNLNSELNHQMEKQVTILEKRKERRLINHLLKLRRREVRISDTEAILYGSIVLILLGLMLFNLWYAATALALTVGMIFSIISYTWEFVESSIALPVTLQTWTRLSEITRRLNELQS